RRQTGRIGAVVAQAGQVKIVAVGVVAFAFVLVPVGAPGGFHIGAHPRVCAGHQRFGVVVLPGNSVVFHAGLFALLKCAVGVKTSTHVLVVAWVALTWLGLHVI